MNFTLLSAGLIPLWHEKACTSLMINIPISVRKCVMNRLLARCYCYPIWTPELPKLCSFKSLATVFSKLPYNHSEHSMLQISHLFSVS